MSSAILLSILFGSTCQNRGTNKTETAAKNDTVVTTPVDSSQALRAAGDTVLPQSSRTETTIKGTTSKTPGAVIHSGPNQAETDSIKKAKSKAKK
ncbi:MAG: hypothetical protein V1733_10360 [bacterium]